jgi:hypothetical protein
VASEEDIEISEVRSVGGWILLLETTRLARIEVRCLREAGGRSEESDEKGMP